MDNDDASLSSAATYQRSNTPGRKQNRSNMSENSSPPLGKFHPNSDDMYHPTLLLVMRVIMKNVE
eukprot:scaffold19705_cov58-Attheya_sp.AAC.5